MLDTTPRLAVPEVDGERGRHDESRQRSGEVVGRVEDETLAGERSRSELGEGETRHPHRQREHQVGDDVGSVALAFALAHRSLDGDHHDENDHREEKEGGDRDAHHGVP